MSRQAGLRQILFVGSALEDLRRFPVRVRKDIGYGLFLAQVGERPAGATLMKGFSDAGVYEIRARDSSGIFRAIYMTQIKTSIFVLHCFQKKSKKGIKTPREHLKLIHQRLKAVRESYRNET